MATHLFLAVALTLAGTALAAPAPPAPRCNPERYAGEIAANAAAAAERVALGSAANLTLLPQEKVCRYCMLAREAAIACRRAASLV